MADRRASLSSVARGRRCSRYVPIVTPDGLRRISSAPLRRILSNLGQWLRSGSSCRSRPRAHPESSRGGTGHGAVRGAAAARATTSGPSTAGVVLGCARPAWTSPRPRRSPSRCPSVSDRAASILVIYRPSWPPFRTRCGLHTLGDAAARPSALPRWNGLRMHARRASAGARERCPSPARCWYPPRRSTD